jgi:hypothetical protein
MSGQYERYPMWLHHPAEQPAVLCDEYATQYGERPPVGYSARPGQARMFPPVMVNNPDQEAYHVSRGYEPGPSTKQAFVAAQAEARLPANYRHQDYPMMVGGQLVQDPQTVVMDHNYPKWVDGPQGKKIVQNAQEELAYLGTEAVDMMDADEGMADADRAFLASIDEAASKASHLPLKRLARQVPKPARRKPPPHTPPAPEELLQQARALGLNVDRRWSVRRILEKMDEKQAEAEAAGQAGEALRPDEGHGTRHDYRQAEG